MKIRVRYFAVLRDRVGCSEELIDTECTTARQLAEDLIIARQLGLPSSLIRLAVNGSFVEGHTPLSEGDELLLLPPVAGG